VSLLPPTQLIFTTVNCPHSFRPAPLEKPATLFTATSSNSNHSLDCTTLLTIPSLSLHPIFLLPHLALLRFVTTLSRLLQHSTAVASSNESPCYWKTLGFNQIALELSHVHQAFILYSPQKKAVYGLTNPTPSLIPFRSLSDPFQVPLRLASSPIIKPTLMH